MKLTQEQKETVLYHLGYNRDTSVNTLTDLDSDYFVITINRMEEIFNEVASVDLLLVEARTDSMALKADTVTLDYEQHVCHLEHEGTKLLKELSNLVGVPLVYNKFTGSRSYGGNVGNDTTFYSYW